MASCKINTLKILLHLLISAIISSSSISAGGRWKFIQRSIGISAMHMQLLHNDRVIIFDRTDFGFSNLSLPNGKCRKDRNDLVVKVDCSAHSVEYNAITNTFRPLMILTDTWCSSATVSPDGDLVQTGGYNDGDRNARVFRPCNNGNCDWMEIRKALSVRRWYSTNQILPDGRAIIVGGRQQFSYEFYYKLISTETIYRLPFLQQTSDREENNLYPFVHLNIDGNLFIFANNRAILLDYTKHRVVRTFPKIPGGDPRNYPSTGSSVLLPLKPSPTEAEILVCGGAPTGSYNQAFQRKKFLTALNTCGRIKITDAKPSWFMETMPVPRVMGDMLLLPNGEVLIINGAGLGTAGWDLGKHPVLSPVIYRPNGVIGKRFDIETSTKIARLYHSAAILLRNGQVLVGGSNPQQFYNFSGVEYPTELSLELFSPDYLNSENMKLRPKIMAFTSPFHISYGKSFNLKYKLGIVSKSSVSVLMIAPSFATHSFSMNQRALFLRLLKMVKVGGFYELSVVAPATAVFAPSGYYMVFIVNGVIPSEGIWVHIK